MKKLMTTLILTFFLFIVVACSEDEDRSFTIDNVTIDAQIETDGSIHVRELYTYTFDSAFEGMTRSIESDVNQFKAYGIDGQTTDPTIATEGLEPLTIEKDDSTWKIYSKSQDETKQVLYSYTIEGSVKKYQDIADLTYSFFDVSNETDLGNVEISIHTPTRTIGENTEFFLHGHAGGELTATEDHIVYTNPLLAAGDTSEVRLIFPAEELSNMKVSKDKQMQEKILTAEWELIERAEHLEQNMDKIIPLIWIFIALVILVAIVIKTNHPNRYRGHKSIDEFAQQLEATDPLFVSYLSHGGYITDQSVIAALFSLKQRGIITLQEVPSLIDKEDMTFRFTWKRNPADVDLADGFLHEWLFTEKDEKGSYFLLESIIDHEDEADAVREKKAEEFDDNYTNWVGLVRSRESYQHLQRPFKGFQWLSVLVTIITFVSFYYVTTVDVISQIEQIVLPVILAILGVAVLIFKHQKWSLLIYYPYLITASLIAFTMTTGTILLVIFYVISLLALLLIPAKYWKEDIHQTIHAIKQSRKLMKTGDYPVGSDSRKLEERLAYALILGQGDEYAKQCGKGGTVSKLDFPLLSHPLDATQSFNSGNLVLLSMFTMNSSTTSPTTTTSSTGGGGAGAF